MLVCGGVYVGQEVCAAISSCNDRLDLNPLCFEEKK